MIGRHNPRLDNDRIQKSYLKRDGVEMTLMKSNELESIHDFIKDERGSRDEEENEEVESLLSEGKSHMSPSNWTGKSRVNSGTFRLNVFQAMHISMLNISKIIMGAVLVVGALIVSVSLIITSKEEIHSQQNYPIKSSNLIFECSSNPKKSSDYKSENDKEDAFQIYDRDDNYANHTPLINNLSQILQEKFDGRNTNYFESKENNARWKLKTFGKHLRSGDKIYESACGIGLTLLSTLQTLEEYLGITNLTVYGNDYLQESVDMANKVIDAAIPPSDQRIIQGLGTKKGSICWADSTNLEFVPDDAFDLVYTGYIDPIIDPLDLATNLTSTREKKKIGIRNCKSKDLEKKKLAEKAQKVQEDWFALWVKEMIRLAKPNKIIVIEEVAPPLCDALNDRGGVKRSWWSQAIIHYKWNVYPNVYIETRTVPGRYHVMLRKNK